MIKANQFSLAVFGMAMFALLPAAADGPLLPSTTDQAVTLVDPELSQSVAPAPLQIPEPPPQLRLPEVIVDSRQWRGVQCGVTDLRFAVFRHADKWEAFWKKGMAPYLPRRYREVPAIDFTKDMVVGVFLGEKRDPHYSVEIRSIKPRQRPDRASLVVKYRPIIQMTGVFNPAFPVQPFHLRRVPRYDGPVDFESVRR